MNSYLVLLKLNNGNDCTETLSYFFGSYSSKLFSLFLAFFSELYTCIMLYKIGPEEERFFIYETQAKKAACLGMP